jgi:phage gp46-like protein
MAMLRVRISEGDDVQPTLLWDSIWAPWKGCADWKIADTDEAHNRGGLRAKGALHTAVTICLFTDKRVPEDHPHAKLVDGDDPRGWWGDGEDIRPELGEREMGSLLWIYERAHLNDEIRRWVEAEALDALATLIFQGVATKIEAIATRPTNPNQLNLEVRIYGADGSMTFNEMFEDIWKQSQTTPKSPTF